MLKYVTDALQQVASEPLGLVFALILGVVMQKKYQLDKFLRQLDKADLLICDELGYLSFSRTGAELLFQVFADRYERGSLLLTSNLPFSEWDQVFQGERMTAALLDRLTHHCHIVEMNGENYRFRESAQQQTGGKGKSAREDRKSRRKWRVKMASGETIPLTPPPGGLY